MKRYEKYKPTGLDWVSKIPTHWGIEKLRYIGIFSASGIDKKIVDGEPLVRIINYTDIYGNASRRLGSDREYMVVSCPVEKRIEHQVKIGDLIFTPSSETIEDIGLSALVDENMVNTAYSYHVLRLRFQKELDHNYKKYLCNNYFVLNQFSSNAKGTTRQILNRDDFNDAIVIIPTKPEQTVIANYLDKKTEQIDSLITQKQKLIELLEEERTAVISQAVTKGINPKVKLTPSGIKWLVKIPEHWDKKKLKYAANVVLGKMLTSDDKGDYHIKPYLRAANLQWLNVDINDVKEMWFSTKELGKFRIKENDLLVSEGGEVGRTCIWRNELEECYIQNSVHKVTFKETINPFFFLYQFYYLSSIGFFESIVNRISIGHLTCEKISEILLFIPPFEEQNKIVHHITTQIQRIVSTISKIEKEIELLQEYRTALISEVVTGKVKVT